ncbi:phage tail tube protein [Agrobacterium rosae]|uniref:Uncharacterized protein n=1 Tax=Agrobacterium rosae TaxID=1972867 RepID=A0AAW9F827_9HYPH|nr:phage tail tube protein [Agrobacterium rosae]MDX8301489.1 hypothetical protein [Agrobacterium rosae]
MTKRFVENLAIIGKMETVYGTDALGLPDANAMMFVNATIEPFVGEDMSRELTLPTMGHQGVILDGSRVRITGELEIAGSGTAGTPPAGAPVLRSCGLREVITAATKVTYTPISRQFESSTFYFNDDGVNHIMLGARGTMTWQLTPKQIPRFSFTLDGLAGTFTDQARPAVDLSKFISPVPVNLANTFFSLHGDAGACEGITFDLGNTIEPRLLINSESIEQTGRAMTGSAIMEAKLLAEKNWIEIAKSHAVGALIARHGTEAGNIFEVNAPAVQIGRPTYGATNKIRNNTLPLMFKPVAGNDEFSITFK